MILLYIVKFTPKARSLRYTVFNLEHQTEGSYANCFRNKHLMILTNENTTEVAEPNFNYIYTGIKGAIMPLASTILLYT
jgi:hypothetical protein